MVHEPERLPGPRRPRGAPAGPDAVRRAVLDAAARLFAARGVDAVSLREIAAEADVQLALISRYVGTRDDLVIAVFDDLSEQLAEAVLSHPLEQQSFEPDSLMGRWTSVAANLAASGRLRSSSTFNPVHSVAQTAMDAYGQDARSARVRAAQVVASALGWRLFEAYLIEAGGLLNESIDDLRDELTRTHRRVGATPLPSPPDPSTKETR